MKFAFASLVTMAAALMPLASASLDITFSADKFERRADDAASKAPAQPAPKVRNPEFGRFLINDYLNNGGARLPRPRNVKVTFPECQWNKKAQGWLDDYGVQCYLTPTYRYHAWSLAKPLDPTASLEKGACADTPDTQDYPKLPEFTMAVPYLYFNNLYDRRCKVRAMIKVPKTNDHDAYWVQAWVIEHDGGYWNDKGVDVLGDPQEGILVDQKLYNKFVNKGEEVPGMLPKPVEWFFLDINTVA